MNRNSFIKLLPALSIMPTAFSTAGKNELNKSEKKKNNSREYWVSILTKIADPVLENLSKEKLKQEMFFESRIAGRIAVTHLEAFGRLICGMAPWLELGDDTSAEGKLRKKYIVLTQKCIAVATNPSSPDYMNFDKVSGGQPLVDAAFFAQGLIRGFNNLWLPLNDATKKNVITAFKLTRSIQPGNNNWVLFSAMIEAFFIKIGEAYEIDKIKNATNLMQQWYKGDGIYGDGPQFHFDYYNSFVMHPMLLDITKILKESGKETEVNYQLILTRAKRYAAIQEKMISPEGTFPVVGRSLAYRFGVFHLLSQIALLKELPKEVEPEQVCAALSAVITKMIEAPGTFNKYGWLQIGYCGHQPNIAEDYISTGSLYLCSVGLLPLGLQADDVFWTGAAKDWTSKKAWSGLDLPADHAIKE